MNPKQLRKTENTKIGEKMDDKNFQKIRSELEQVDEKDEEHLPNSLSVTADDYLPQFGLTRAEIKTDDSRGSTAIYAKDDTIKLQQSKDQHI